MNLAENVFKLSEIKICGEKIEFVISLCCSNDQTKNAYLNNYFEGLFIDIRGQRYNLYAEIKNDHLSGEMLCDTVLANVTNANGRPMRLWIRLRIGNTVIEQPVDIGKKPILLPVRCSKPLVFVPVSDYKFIFQIKPSDRLTADFALSLEQNNLIICKNINIIDSDVKLTLSLPGLFDGLPQDTKNDSRICLVWYDAEKDQNYYFHSVPCCECEIIYTLSSDEMNLLNSIDGEKKVFELIMTDQKGTKYQIIMDEALEFEQCVLPVSDFFAQLFADEGSLKVNMANYQTFEIFSVNKDYITFQYIKRSYDIEILDITAQRVNTDLEYSLPFEITDDNEKSTLLTVHLQFSEKENLFRTGVYQFWMVIREGVETKNLLKIHCQKALTENTYIISQIPYTILGSRYYNCFFYNDTSGTLKCGIFPKVLKTGITDHYIENGKFCWVMSIYKEPFFDRKIRIITETNGGHRIDFEQKTIYEDEIKTDILMQTGADYLCEEVSNESFHPFVVIEGRENIKIPIQNNLKNVPVANRETQIFNHFFTSKNGDFNRIWGDYKKDSYTFGISDDLKFFELKECCRSNDYIVLSAVLDPNFKIDTNSVSFVLENELEEKRIVVKSAVSDSVLTAKIDTSTLNFGDYNIYAVTDSGMKSGLAVRSVPEPLYFYDREKKLLPLKNDEVLFLSVREILLFENPQKAEKYLHIAEDALKKENGKRKIWLVGENLGLSARDNGLAFFEYCMAHKSPNEEVYFVTKDKNKDLDNLSQYKNHVVMYDSEEHIRLDAMAEFYIVSHGIRDVMPSLYHNQIGVYRKPVVYLQHGIIAMKVVGIDNKSYGGSIRKFIVTSEFEKRLLIKNHQFWDHELAVTGLSRYDKLTSSETNNGYIWIMPTWRDWLVSSPRDFAYSEFCTYYRRLLSDERVLELLRQKNCKIVFSLHIEFEKFKPFFKDLENDVVEITDMHQKPINDRIKECSMIITDYSSIIFDVVYLKKPVLFFQFDRDSYDLYRGSYIDMENELPGEVAYDFETLTDALVRTVNSGFKISEPYLQRRKKFFDYEDSKNSERIYKTVLELREEMADEH